MSDAIGIRSSKPAATLAVAILLALPSHAFAAGATVPSGAVTAAPNVIKYTPNLSVATLADRPSTDLVELSDGRRVPLGDVRRLAAAVQNARAARGPHVLPALAARPAATGTPVSNASDLAAALKRGDQETVVLPSGRRATVAQLRVAKELADRQAGRSVARPVQRANLSGPAVKVTAQTDFKTLLNQPDSTVLESPQGTRVTVGEIKQYFARRGKTAMRR